MSNEPTIVRRDLRTSILRDAESIHRAVEILTALAGMKETRADPSGKRIRVQYDVTKLHYPSLLQALEVAGLLTKLAWWERLKSSWYCNQDINTRDNIEAKPTPCCSNPTGITGLNGKQKHR